MAAPRVLLFTAALCFVMACGAVPAPSGDAAAAAFVTRIYDAYKGKDSKGIVLDNDARIRRYFEPSLAALIIKDRAAAAKRNEVPTLDGDPFVDAQDVEISGIDIAVNDVPPDKAVAIVNFKNFDEPMKVVLNLVKIANEWRISDILSTRDRRTSSLRGLFKH